MYLRFHSSSRANLPLKVLSSLNASSTNETPRKNSCNADDFIKSFIQNLSLRPTSDSMNASTNDQTSKDNSNSRQLSSAKKSSLKGPASKSSSVESCDLRYDEFMDEVTLLRLSSADPSVELTHKQHVDKIVSALKVCGFFENFEFISKYYASN